MYAVFLQASGLNNIAQVIITPAHAGADIQVYFRFTLPGARGRSARWENVTANPAPYFAKIGDRRLDREPVAIRFTDNDARQVRERGAPTNIGTKAISSVQRHAVSERTVEQVFDGGSLLLIVRDQDPILATWLPQQGSTASTPARISTPVDVTPTAPAVHTVNQPESTMRMASVPDVSIAKAYVHRNVYGREDFEIFAKARQRRENVLLKGPTGAAKTMSALAFAASEGLPTFTISGSVNFEASEALGQMMLDPATGMPYFQYGGAIEVIRNGGVLILDEVNFIPSKVITPLFPLLDDRREIVLKQNRGEIIKAHPNLLIVATMNPGYLGTQAMNFALANRFDHHLEWGYDEAVEKKLIPFKAIRDLAFQLRGEEAAKKISTPVPTNSLMSIVTNTQDFGIDYALANFLARFDDTEQDAVKLTIAAHRANIESDLGIAVDIAVEQDEVFVQSATNNQTQEWISVLTAATAAPTV